MASQINTMSASFHNLHPIIPSFPDHSFGRSALLTRNMTANLPFSYYTPRGTIYYVPSNVATDRSQARFPDPPCRPRQRRPHSIHITRLPAGFVPFDLRPLQPPLEPKKPSRFRLELRKLASRESAKRVLGSVFSSLTPNSSTASSSAASASTSRSSSPDTTAPRASFQAASADPTSLYSRRSRLSACSGLDDPTMLRPSLDNSPGVLATSNVSINSVRSIETEKPVASGNGVAVSIILAEPNIFLNGLDHDGTTRDSSSSTSALLRGKLQLNVTKSAKIKAVTLKFTGKAKTDWPEGIPPEKTQTFEEESLRHQVMPFFNALYEGSETGYGTLCNYTLRDKSATSSVTNLSSTALDQPSSPRESTGGFSIPGISNRSSRSSTLLSAKDVKRLSLQSNQSRSFTKSESPFGPTPAQKGYKVFHPGIYEYSFELPIDNNSPETTNLQLASVKWQLEALVERAGTFRPNLQGFKEIPVIRSPSEDSLELVEPISISRKWEDQLHYEIMISGKAFPLGSRIPIAFKLTPLAKVQVHKIRVYVSENCEYFTSNRKVTRKDVTRKILLLEKAAGKPLAKEYSTSDVNILRGGEFDPERRASARATAQRFREMEAKRSGTVAQELPEPTENMLGDIDLGLEQYWGSTEMEMNVQLPTCEMMEKERMKKLHPDCSWKNANVHHWIKIVMRISRLDTDDPTGKKRRHFEISIDSPFTILDCRASRDNLALPEYSGLNANTLSQQHVCGCPNAAFTNVSPGSSSGEVPTLNSMNEGDGSPDGPEIYVPDLARPPQAHLSSNAMVQRPIHMLRNPSYNPPAFDAEQPPPPMATPPPLYDHVVGTPSHDGLADYFARLGEAYDDDQYSDDDMNRAYSNGRVNVANPRTPGGRIARSMDIDRNFMFNPAAFNNTLSRESEGTPVQPA